MSYPTPPSELALALKFDVEKLRPWEYWGWEADESYLVTTLSERFRTEYQAERRAAGRDAERRAAMKPGQG